VLSNVLSEKKGEEIEITEEDVSKIRSKSGINDICSSKYKDQIKSSKVDIGIKLVELLFLSYEHKPDDKIFERPVFKMMDRIIESAILNNQPVDRVSEIKNREILVDMIKSKRKG
jgi:hypothetical protein